MNPYGKTKNWFCRTDRCDSTSVGGRTVPSLLRLDSTGNTLCKRDNHTSLNKSMASCFAKTVGGIMQKNNFSKDNFVGSMSDFPILQNTCDFACDKNMAAKNSDSRNMPVASCFGSFQGLAGCLGLNACSSISQHQTLHHGHFQLPYVQFHPAVVTAFPNQTDSAKKQLVKCQSQRTGKKSNRYFRYGWKAPPRKSSPEGEKSGAWPTKSEDASVRKKQKCDNSERTQQDKEKYSEKKKEEKAKYNDDSKDCLSSHMCNLSLGESVAIENALNDGTPLSSDDTEVDKSKPDWFSIGRRYSENKLSPSNTVTVLDNWDDEICEEIQSESSKLQEEILDLLATDDVKISASNTCSKNIGDESLQSMDIECENTCATNGELKLLNCNDSKQMVKDNEDSAHQCQNNEPHAVLFQRSMNKKCRPSNKKRSRRKSSKHSKSFRCDQGQKRKLEDGNPSNFGASAIAFIMGNCAPHSILDSESDFSFDSDEDSCESMEDDIDFQFAGPFSFCEKAIFPTSSSPGQEVSQAVSAANRAWHIGSQESSRKDAPLENKKVHFATAENLTEMHEADEWNRKGHWEEYARDRERFKRRIEEVQRVLDPVLNQSHREHVFKRPHTA